MHRMKTTTMALALAAGLLIALAPAQEPQPTPGAAQQAPAVKRQPQAQSQEELRTTRTGRTPPRSNCFSCSRSPLLNSIVGFCCLAMPLHQHGRRSNISNQKCSCASFLTGQGTSCSAVLRVHKCQQGGRWEAGNRPRKSPEGPKRAAMASPKGLWRYELEPTGRLVYALGRRGSSNRKFRI